MNNQNEYVVVVLKPKVIFYAWLADVLLALKQNSLLEQKKIDLDNTVLIIPNGKSEEGFGEFFDQHWEAILHQEFRRWTFDQTLWPKRLDLELLLEFFDLETHTSVVTPTQSISNAMAIADDYKVIFVDSKLPVKEWLKDIFSAMNKSPELIEKIDMSSLLKDSTAYLVPKNDSKFLEKEAIRIFEFELMQFIEMKEYWPKNRTLDLFLEWFDFDIYSRIFIP